MVIKVKHLKKGDTVVGLWGVERGKSGKVLDVSTKSGKIRVEGLGTVKKHVKPSQTQPKGGIVEELRWFPAAKFQVASASGKPSGRVGFQVIEGKKERVFRSEAVKRKAKS